MNSILTIEIGQKATCLGNAYFCLESQQQYETDDPIDHTCLFKNPQENTPRRICFGQKNELDALKYLNYTYLIDEKKFDPKKPVEKSLWNQNVESKLEDIEEEITEFKEEIKEKEEKDSDDEEEKKEEEEQKETNPYYPLFKYSIPEKKYLVAIQNQVQEEFLPFTSGKEIWKQEQYREDYEEPIRHAFEESDYLSSFQIFADSDNGFGSFTKELIYLLEDECPKKTQILISLSDQNLYKDNNLQNSVQQINELIALQTFSETSTVVIPIDISNIKQLQLLNQDVINQSDFNAYMAMSMFISNITLPYRLKENSGMRDFLKNLLPLPHNNIFNIAADIPLINEKKDHINSEKYILNFKQNMSQYNTFQKMPIYNQRMESFGESYLLRGFVNLPKQPPTTRGFDLKILDSILNTSKYPEIFNKETYTYYNPGVEVEQNDTFNMDSIPLHSCLFCNESYKFNLRNSINQYKKSDRKAKNHFLKDDFASDDFRETEEYLETLYDSYNVSEDL